MQESVFVCVFYRDGKVVAHATSPTRDFPFPNLDESVDDSPAPNDESTSAFGEGFDNFTEVMTGFQEFMPLLMSFSPIFAPRASDVTLPYLEANGTIVETDEDRRVYSLALDRYYEFRQLLDVIDMAHHTARELPRMLMTGLVSSLDYHLAAIYRNTIKSVPSVVFDSERKHSTSEILSLSSIDDFKFRLIEQEVELVSRKSFQEQMRWLEKVLKLDPIEKHFKRFPTLIEIIERRNLFVHNGGFLNERYIENLRSSGHSTEGLQVGKELHVSRKYFTEAVSVIIEFGVTLTQIAWRKLCPGEINQADTAINRYTYSLIERGEYEDAERLLKTFHKWRNLSSDEIRRMMIVNLANTRRLTGDTAGALMVIDSEDWSAVGRKFKSCVAAVRGETATVIEAMRQMGPTGDIKPEDYESWPVFYGIRDAEEFKSAFMEVFGRSFSPKPEKRRIAISLLEQIHRSLEVNDSPDTPSQAEGS